MPSVVTLKARQRQMLEFMEDTKAYRFIALGRSTAWPDDIHPPVPDDKKQELEDKFTKKRIEALQNILDT